MSTNSELYVAYMHRNTTVPQYIYIYIYIEIKWTERFREFLSRDHSVPQIQH